MKIEDKVKFGSYEEIENNLSCLGLELRRCALDMPVGKKDDYIGFALCKLVSYAASLTETLISFLKMSIELNAWTARNLFECYLIASYIISDISNAKEFLAQKATDELEIYESLLTLKHSGTTKDAEKPVLERMEHIRNTMKKHSLAKLNHWTVSRLAKQTGNKEEYDVFFKLYSKYVHPSSWLINGEKSEFDNQTYRNVFLIQAQYYISCLLKIVSDYRIKKSAN